MKALMTSAESDTLDDLLKKARRRDVFLQAADGEQFVLARVTDMQAFDIGSSDDFEWEIEVTRKNEKLMEFLNERGATRRTGQGIPLAEVRRRLG